jgi:hypothetical protein
MNVKTYLNIGLTDTTTDDLISLLISSIQTTVETYCHRHFDINTYTAEQHIVNHLIFPKETPLISVLSIVRLEADVGDEAPDVNANMAYRQFPRYVELLDYKYMTMGNKLKYIEREESYVEITYTAGYTAVPADLCLAAIKLVSLEYKDSTEDRIGLISSHEGGESSAFVAKGIDTEMPLSISCVLDRYKRVVA